jgi:hypothetical protein
MRRPDLFDLRAARRLLRGLTPSGIVEDDVPASLEAAQAAADPPRMATATLVEGRTLGAHPVAGTPTVQFRAFLDGTQRSHVVAYEGGVPIVFAQAAAVIRVRIERRMRTWGQGAVIHRGLYDPRSLLSRETWLALSEAGIPVTDTLVDAPQTTSAHPFELLRMAVNAVGARREMLEAELAAHWCAQESASLYVDGPLPRVQTAASASVCVGVVKSHHTIYADARELRTILALREGERSSVLQVQGKRQRPVASWYLRLREPVGHEPTWGLVRVEVGIPEGDGPLDALPAYAEEVSRWILAEVVPLALPDGRWDRMVYGIRDCEEYLRVI